MQRYPLILAVVAVGILFMPAISSARFDYTPRLSLSEEYNDNIFLAPANLESDFITTIIPGISLDWVAKAASLKLDYSLEFRKYAENDSQDQTAIKDIQRGLALGQLFPGRDFSITALQDFSTEAVDSRLPSVADNTNVNRTNVSRSIINPLYRCD